MDRVRGQQMPKTGPTLDYLGTSKCPSLFSRSLPLLDEAFTSENWIVSVINREAFKLLTFSCRFEFSKSRKRTY